MDDPRPRKTYPSKEFGPVILTTDGEGHYIDREQRFAAMLVLTLYSVEYDAAGKLDFVYGGVHLRYSDPTVFARWEMPYTDRTVENGVNEYLSTIGIPGHVEWSEQGRQSVTCGDFDGDDAIFQHCFPEAFR